MEVPPNAGGEDVKTAGGAGNGHEESMMERTRRMTEERMAEIESDPELNGHTPNRWERQAQRLRKKAENILRSGPQSTAELAEKLNISYDETQIMVDDMSEQVVRDRGGRLHWKEEEE